MADDDNTRSYRSGAPFPARSGGSSGHAGGQGGDPLAELARLIGQHDPFADLGRGAPARDQRPAPRDLAPLPPAPADEWRSARSTPAADHQDRYQERPADDYAARDYSRQDYADQTYPSRDYPSQSYPAQYPNPEQDYHARGGGSDHDPHHDQNGYSDRGYDDGSDSRYGDQRSYRAADEPQHGERSPFDHQDYVQDGYANFTPGAQGRYDQPYAQDGVDDGYQDSRYQSQGRPPLGDDAGYDDAPRSRGRGGIITIVAVLALAMLGTAGAFAYRSYFGGGSTGAPPVIRADAGPNKVVPATQGDNATSKLSQDRFADRSGNERVVSREEQPISFGNASVTSVTPRPVAPGQAPPGLPANATSLAPSNGTTGGEPRRVQTVRIRPDQQQSGGDPFAAQRNDATSSTRGATSRAAAAPRQAAPPPAQNPAANANSSIPLTPQSDPAPLPSIASRTPAVPRAPAAAAPVRNATETNGHFVQLSAQRSEDEAESSFRAMQAKFPNLLGNREAVIRRKDVSGKGTFFGAQVGPFASREEAVQLCDSLKSQGGTCIVQKN